ncbi:MAG: hypothetical protein LBB50_03615 [Oscillospiraceae bacterium]|jgi:hypothetical protein|nr:hypothetical protein [Oscillospiraceae bacterium]
MKELVLFYSYAGHTRQNAALFARESTLDTCEIVPQKSIGKVKAFTLGSVQSIKGRGIPIVPPAVSFKDYDAFHIFAPVWAGSIAAPMNAALALLPQGATLHLHLVSASGGSNQEKNEHRLVDAGFNVASYEDIRG